MTRDKMIALILSSTNKAFLSEVSYLVNDVGDREYSYDAVDAALDAEERALGWSKDKGNVDAPAILRGARGALIAIGFYRPMSAEEIANTYTLSGRSPWAFKLRGVAYTNDDPASTWMSPDDEAKDE